MNIDAKLRSGNVKPRRPLRTDFTSNITEHIMAHPRAPRMGLKGFIMKLLDKPALAIASVVVAFAISGTAYAAVVNWPNVSAFFSGEQQTSQGRVVKVDTDNCHTDNAFTITKPASERGGPRYFMIKPDSKFTNEQVTQLVLGNCEQGAQSDALQQKLDQLPSGNNIVGGYDSVITAISATSMSIEAEFPVGSEIKHIKKTFNRIDPNVQVYYKADTLQFGDLKVGDNIVFNYRAEGAARQSETLSPVDLNTDEATILTIVKNTPAAVKANEFRKYLGNQYEEVVPCDSNETGYCDVEEYYQNREKAKQQ